MNERLRRVELGGTGLHAGVMGLGAGGHSRLGLSRGATEDEAAGVVRRALDLGVNFIDTAECYNTEVVIGRALRESGREGVVISTKKTPIGPEGDPLSGGEILSGLDASLRRLGTDCVDVYHMHGVAPGLYERVRDEALPALERAKAAGKVRLAGITEAFASDPRHETLAKALADPWDVMMVGFNVLNQTARERVLAPAIDGGVGILVMFAVRRALSRAEELGRVVADLVARGKVDAAELPDPSSPDWPLGALAREAGVESVTDLAYRFARDEPGVHIVLSGTGSIQHLEANARSLAGPPLPTAVAARLGRVFRRVDNVSGN